ncbi:nucleoside hydrolase [Pseudoduganella namucuonensis]|uniref:Purine nucleosidase n=1 Tax=Pseudoduganella namucuonensis TaxID=1035707 RepID=A0A1I7K8Q1_9BURK|nr:nucleoside hydrolase [Pseudoduganella namucuonensis]SFU93809.1 purine nucleosidase [Pseudoduganella namucuonensis]
MRHIIIDCDPGIDDALALLLAAGSPALELLAVTTVAGNRPVATTSVNARRLLDLAGRGRVPVYAGAARPLGYAEPRCNLVHGEDGVGGVDLGAAAPVQEGHAAVRLVELLAAHPPHSVELVAVGPLTNLALAESLAPGILRRARRLLVMGGALRVPGNVTPAAEFNFYADPVAAEMVLASGANTMLFPLDVTSSAIMSPSWIGSFGELDTACGRAAAAMLRAYAALDPLLHDACPVAWLLDETLFTGEPCHLEVDWRPGATAGHVLARFGEMMDGGHQANAMAMTAVRNDALLALVRAAIGTLP